MRRWIDSALTWPPRHPLAALLLALACVAASLLSMGRLTTDGSIQSMFPSGDPASAAMARVLNDFSAADDLLVLASLPPGATDSSALGAFATRVQDQLRASPLVQAVVWQVDPQSRSFFQNEVAPAAIYYLSDTAFAAARRRLTLPEMTAQIRQNEAMIAAPGPAAGALARTLLQDPLRLRDFLTAELAARRPVQSSGSSGEFFTTDGRGLLIRIVGKQSLGDIEFAKSLTAAVRTACDAANTDHLHLDISGGYAIAAASEQAIRRDMIVSVVSSIVLLQLLFAAAYRRPVRYFLLAFVPIAVGIVLGFGVRAALWRTISPAAATVGAILAGLGIDYTVLYLPHYHAARLSGMHAPQAAIKTTVALWPTLLAACVTSVIGFVAVGSSSVPALRDFAVVGSLGLAGALLASLWVLPALLALLDRGPAGAPRTRLSLQPLLSWIDRHRRLCLGTTIAILVLATGFFLFLPGDRFPLESDLTVMHPRPNPPLDAQAVIARRMGTDPGSMLIHLQADSDEQLLERAAEVDRRLHDPQLRRIGLTGTYGLATLLPDPAVVAARRNSFTPAQVDQVIADFRTAIAASSFAESAYEPYITFLRRMLSGPPAPSIADLLRYPRLAETFLPRARLNGTSTNPQAITLVFFDRPMDDRTSRVAAVSAVRSAISGVPGATLTGLGVMSLDTEETVRHDLPRLAAVALVMVALYLLAHYRSLRLALLALLPALFSLGCLGATMRIGGGKLNLVNLIALPLLIGIDVDYGIFLVSFAQGRRSSSESAASAHAVTVSAASNVLGFGSLITTSVPAIRSLGWAVGLGVAFCYGGALFLLKPLLKASTREPS